MPKSKFLASALLLLFVLTFSSCGLFKKGGKNCDCPKFGTEQHDPEVE